MSRVDYRTINPNERRKMLNKLSKIFAALQEEDQVELLLSRLLTESEVVMLTRRLQIAEMLVRGLTYEQIRRKLGVGMSTIQTADGWLTDVAHEYTLVRQQNRKKEKLNQRQSRKKQQRSSTIPGTLAHTIAHDSRFVLIRLLLG